MVASDRPQWAGLVRCAARPIRSAPNSRRFVYRAVGSHWVDDACECFPSYHSNVASPSCAHYPPPRRRPSPHAGGTRTHRASPRPQARWENQPTTLTRAPVPPSGPKARQNAFEAFRWGAVYSRASIATRRFCGTDTVSRALTIGGPGADPCAPCVRRRRRGLRTQVMVKATGLPTGLRARAGQERSAGAGRDLTTAVQELDAVDRVCDGGCSVGRTAQGAQRAPRMAKKRQKGRSGGFRRCRSEDGPPDLLSWGWVEISGT